MDSIRIGKHMRIEEQNRIVADAIAAAGMKDIVILDPKGDLEQMMPAHKIEEDGEDGLRIFCTLRTTSC